MNQHNSVAKSNDANMKSYAKRIENLDKKEFNNKSHKIALEYKNKYNINTEPYLNSINKALKTKKDYDNRIKSNKIRVSRARTEVIKAKSKLKNK